MDPVGAAPIVLIAYLLNMVIAWAIFTGANRLTRCFGTGGTQALSKVTHLLLAAIAVKMMRQGVLEILSSQISGTIP